MTVAEYKGKDIPLGTLIQFLNKQVLNSIMKKALKIIIERDADGELWGRTKYKGNLIIDSAKSLDSLKRKFKQLLYDFENIEVEQFDVSFDLTSFFEQYSFLNVSSIAKKAEINPTLMRQYASGLKFPSEDRVKQIEIAVNSIGKELSRVRLHKKFKTYA